MKELSQYKEEIFRRSEHKIRQRKKQRRIALGVSIPLCLCLVVSGAMFGRQLTNFKSDAAAEMAPECGIPMDGMAPAPIYRVNDPVLWKAILDAPVAESGKPENGSLQEHADAVLDNAAPVIRIILVGGERYQLTGRSLYCETTGERRTLNHEQYQRLEALLEQEAAYE